MRISKEKCIGSSCSQCLKNCPTGVFMNVPEGQFDPNRDAISEQIVPYYDEFCNKCGVCLQLCPRQCITLE